MVKFRQRGYQNHPQCLVKHTGGRDVAQLVEYLFGLHQALGLSPGPEWWCVPAIPELGRKIREIRNPRPGWGSETLSQNTTGSKR